MRNMDKKELVIDGVTYVPKGSESRAMPKTQKGLTYCIVRTYSAGVFAGWFDTKTKGKEGTVFNARRLWYWDGANSLSELSVNGVSKPQNCKFPIEVSEVKLTEIIEVLPCSEKAKKSIAEVKVWQQ